MEETILVIEEARTGKLDAFYHLTHDADGRGDDNMISGSGEVCLLTRILTFNNQYL